MAAPKPTKAPRAVRKALKKEVVSKAAANTMVSKSPGSTPLRKSDFANKDASARNAAQRGGVRSGTVKRLVKKGQKGAAALMKSGSGTPAAYAESKTAAAEKNTASVKAKVEKKAAVKAQTKAAKTYTKPFNAKKQK